MFLFPKVLLLYAILDYPEYKKQQQSRDIKKEAIWGGQKIDTVCECAYVHVYLFFISSVQSLSPVQLFVTPWTTACRASLSITNSWSLLKLMSIESEMPSNHLILCCPLLLLPSIFPSIKVFSNESVFPKYWNIYYSSYIYVYIKQQLKWTKSYIESSFASIHMVKNVSEYACTLYKSNIADRVNISLKADIFQGHT